MKNNYCSDLLTIGEFCNYARISRGTFYNLKARGDEPPMVEVGKRRFVRRSAADAWLQSSQSKAAPSVWHEDLFISLAEAREQILAVRRPPAYLLHVIQPIARALDQIGQQIPPDRRRELNHSVIGGRA